MVAAAIVGAAVVGAAGSAAAGNAQKSAAKKASAAQTQATDQVLQLDREIYQDQRQLLAPAARAGAEARARQMLMMGYSPDQVRSYLRETNAAVDRPVGSLGSGVGYGGGSGVIDLSPDEYSWVDEFDPQSFLESTPGYQFRLNEGTKALERSAAARGNLFSGQTGQALTEFGQNYGSAEWGNLFDQFGTIAGDGSESADTIVQVGGQFGDSAGANLRAVGNARASGYLNQGTAQANTYQGIADSIGGAIGAWGAYGSKTPTKKGWFS